MGKLLPISTISTVTSTLKASVNCTSNSEACKEFPKVKVPNIDFSKECIVIWVPGTDYHKIPKTFSKYVKSNFTNSTIILADYLASWNLLSSIPHGIITLSSTLDYIKKNKKKNTKVFLAGHSQGALVIGEVLAQKKYLDLVERAVLFNHPGVSKHHYDGSKKISEFNNKYDISTFNLAKSDTEKEKVIRAVSSFMTGDISKGLYLLKVGVTHPLDTVWLGISSLRLLPVPVFKNIPPFHDVSDRGYQQGIEYLKTGITDPKLSDE